MDDADPVALGTRQVPQVDVLTTEAHIAAVVGLDVSAEQLDQRRLARAVLADERVDLAGHHLQVCVSEGALARVRLRQHGSTSRTGWSRVWPGPTRLDVSDIVCTVVVRQGSFSRPRGP